MSISSFSSFCIWPFSMEEPMSVPQPSQHLNQIMEEPLTVPQPSQNMTPNVEEPMSVQQPIQYLNEGLEESPSVLLPSLPNRDNIFWPIWTMCTLLAKLNNTAHSVYTCTAVYTQLYNYMAPAWPQVSLTLDTWHKFVTHTTQKDTQTAVFVDLLRI
jgi:hypothetical protein